MPAPEPLATVVTTNNVAGTNYDVKLPATSGGETLLVTLIRRSGAVAVPQTAGDWDAKLHDAGTAISTDYRLETWIEYETPAGALDRTRRFTGSSRPFVAVAQSYPACEPTLTVSSTAGDANTAVMTPPNNLTALTDATWVGVLATATGQTYTSPANWTEDADAFCTGTNSTGVVVAHRVMTAGALPSGQDFTRSDAGQSGVFFTGSVLLYELGANFAPTADAGTDQIVAVGDTVTLDGSGSSDPDGTIASWDWAHTTTGSDHPTPTLTNVGATSEQVTFVADRVAAYEFTLMVADNEAATDTDTVGVLVVPGTSPVKVRRDGLWVPAALRGRSSGVWA